MGVGDCKCQPKLNRAVVPAAGKRAASARLAETWPVRPAPTTRCNAALPITTIARLRPACTHQPPHVVRFCPRQVIGKARVPIVKFETVDYGNLAFDVSFDVANGPQVCAQRARAAAPVGAGPEGSVLLRKALGARAVAKKRREGRDTPGVNRATPCHATDHAGDRSHALLLHGLPAMTCQHHTRGTRHAMPVDAPPPPPRRARTPGLQAAELVKEMTGRWPMMRPLILALKLFLQQRELNEVYTGGIGSYALITLVSAFLQMHASRRSKQVRRGERGGSAWPGRGGMHRRLREGAMCSSPTSRSHHFRKVHAVAELVTAGTAGPCLAFLRVRAGGMGRKRDLSSRVCASGGSRSRGGRWQAAAQRRRGCQGTAAAGGHRGRRRRRRQQRVCGAGPWRAAGGLLPLLRPRRQHARRERDRCVRSAAVALLVVLLI